MAVVRLFVLFYLYYLHCIVTAKKCNNHNPCDLKTGELLSYPPQLLSRNGQLQMTLEVQMSKVTVGGWLNLWRRTYNRMLGGPTWRVRPGDSITVNLVNDLGSNTADNAQNQLRLANTTNLYLHGLHVSPQTNDATIRVNPGQMRKYSYKLDCQHPPGTYWYHPHVHGSSMFQTLSGMAGMIVVEDIDDGDSQSISSYSCPKHCDHEVHLLFQPTMLYKIEEGGFSFARVQKRIRDNVLFRNRQRLPKGSILEAWLINRENNVQYFTTNGQIQPKIRIQTGKTMRFRMVNAGGLHVLEIEVPSNKRGDRCEVLEIARDGVYLPQPESPRLGTSILPQGGTLDWLVRCDYPGNYEIESVPHSRDNSVLGRGIRFRGVLAMIEVVRTKNNFKKATLTAKFGQEISMALPAAPGSYMPNLMNVAQEDISGKFVVEAAGNNLLNRGKYTGPKNPIRHQMQLDGVQEWTLLNADPSNAHTLHVQGNHFQIIERNEYTGPISITGSGGKHYMLDKKGNFCKMPEDESRPFALFGKKKAGLRRSKYRHFTASGLAQPGQWRNTIIIPPLTNITIRLLPRHYVGRVMVHSHNLLRSDLGMKMMVEVAEKGKVAADDELTSLDEGMPGTCKPEDYYPIVSSPKLTLGRKTFNDFFTWLYELKPTYRTKYGDQRYLSGLYAAYLRQRDGDVTDGHHLKDFFKWAYNKFPNYKNYYGDQGYLCELYDFYIAKNVAPTSVKKIFA